MGGTDKRIPGGLVASQPKPMGSPDSGPKDPVSRGQEGQHGGRVLEAGLYMNTNTEKNFIFQIKIVKDSGVFQDEIKSSLSY